MIVSSPVIRDLKPSARVANEFILVELRVLITKSTQQGKVDEKIVKLPN